MKKILITAISLGLSFNASAFFSVKNLEKTALDKVKEAQKSQKTKSDPNTCANFSGKWKGVCALNGKKEEDTLNIQQYNCAEIIFLREHGESQRYDLTGVGLENSGKTGFFSGLGILMGAKWSADNKVVQAEGLALINSPFLPSPHTMKISAQMLMDGTDLVTFSKVEGNSQPENDGERNCRFTKNQ